VSSRYADRVEPSWHMDGRGLSDEDIPDVIVANEDTGAPMADTGFDPDSGF